MVEFFQSYGILILIGIALIGLFAWISRRGHHNQVQPTGQVQQTGKNNQDNNNQRRGGGCC